MFSKSAQYTLKAAIFLAHRDDPSIPVGTSELSKAINAPPQFLAKTLQKLVHANIISSTRGNNGGVFLTNSNLQTPLVAILNEIDSNAGLKTCILGKTPCDSNQPCILHKDFISVREELNDFFRNHKLADFRIIRDEEFKKRFNWIVKNYDNVAP